MFSATARDGFHITLESRINIIEGLDENKEQLHSRDREAADSLITQFIESSGALSARQWKFAEDLYVRATGAEPLYGDFDAVQVMFRIAGEHLKMPKIRLLSQSGRYVQLNFYPDTKLIKVFVDGWQGHGVRKYAGRITSEGVLQPYSADRCGEDVKRVIHEFSLDPAAVSKAMASKLGCCIYCATRLSDPESKRVGYGPICAGHFGLPWGGQSNERVVLPENLEELFV